MTDTPSRGCSACREGRALDFAIAMAFQPIVDLRTGRPWAYEALVRGADGESAASVLARVTPENRYAFDQQCRVAAIEGAVAAGLLETGARLSINFLPNAVYSPKACIQLTLRTAQATGLPTDRLMFEFTEDERMADPAHVLNIVESYREMGFTTALDDFGAGYAGLGLLARFQPDVIKLDMALLRGLDASEPRRMIVESMVGLCRRLGVTVIAEGIETRGELDAVRALGIELVQGYLLAKPAFEALPEPVLA
ncbi:EAL domain-containing protein [Sphingomonas desiccabilis]|uniref:EAL domain-containing protein n=1 Tax=Sphingomonas desiccabilis TaxID=429134 RepID=UPI0017AC217F|nr:EAL domain-containing protein (putative c-di-GMP-specific phosphodiesterase class I) [Sphingomonas desiccabilis]